MKMKEGDIMNAQKILNLIQELEEKYPCIEYPEDDDMDYNEVEHELERHRKRWNELKEELRKQNLY